MRFWAKFGNIFPMSRHSRAKFRYAAQKFTCESGCAVDDEVITVLNHSDNWFDSKAKLEYFLFRS